MIRICIIFEEYGFIESDTVYFVRGILLLSFRYKRLIRAEKFGA
jgi:hypothetical protein